MIVKIIKGHSFKGAAAYLLHDKEASSAERVEWTQTLNMHTKNPQAAWRVMAGTAMKAPLLKQQAGIRNTGRKAAVGDVQHIVLSWHEDERDSIDSDQKMLAAEGVIKALGASDRQAIIVAHNDTDNPHIHILLNRVSPLDGRLLTSSRERRKTSAWALKYRKDRGELQYCPQREKNSDRRRRGYKTKCKSIPRHIFEAELAARGVANDNPNNLDKIRARLNKKTNSLGVDNSRTAKRQKAEWRKLEDRHFDARERINAEAAKGLKKSKRDIEKSYRPRIEELDRLDDAETARFIENEKTVLGRTVNMFKVMDTNRTALHGDRLRVLSQTFGGVFSSTERAKLLKYGQERRHDHLAAKYRAEIRKKTKQINKTKKLQLGNEDSLFLARRSTLEAKHQGEQEQQQKAWNVLKNEREAAFAEFAKAHEMGAEFKGKSARESLSERAKKIRQEPAREQDNERDRD